MFVQIDELRHVGLLRDAKLIGYPSREENAVDGEVESQTAELDARASCKSPFNPANLTR